MMWASNRQLSHREHPMTTTAPEIAAPASYLAGSQSGYMTGSSLTIDGGYIL